MGPYVPMKEMSVMFVMFVMSVMKCLMSQVVEGHGPKRSVTGSEGMNALTSGLYKAELQCSLN